MTPRDCAKDLIRVYVERGDSVEQLAAGMLGVVSDKYDAQIGGYAATPECDLEADIWKPVKLKRFQLAVTEIKGKACLHIFDLYELYAEIKNGFEQKTLF